MTWVYPVNITILGPGAIGSLWACYLSKAGHRVSLWHRQQSSIQQLTLSEQSYSFPSNDPNELSHCDLLLVTVKAWQVQEALQPLLKNLHSDTIIMLMHNGMGAYEELEDQLKAFPVVLSTTTQAAFKPNKEHINHTGQGTTVVGAANPLGQRCQFITDVLNHALPQVEWLEEIQTALWKKLAINCAINPLTAIHQCSNGSLAEQKYQNTIIKICQEVHQVMHKVGILYSLEELESTVHSVIQSTAKNYSSMHQDVHYQRKTEIDYITGYLLNKAKQLQLDTPTNRDLFQQIKQLNNKANS